MGIFKIRHAIPDDQNGLDALVHEGNVFHQQLLPEYLVPISAENPGRKAPAITDLPPDNALFVAISETGAIAGFLLANVMPPEPDDWISKKLARVDMVVVKQEFRGQRLGQQLMKSGEEWAKERGCHGIRLGVMARNEGAYKLYKSLGYSDFVYEMDKMFDS